MSTHDLYCLNSNKICYKSPSGTCIDLMLTNRKHCFKNRHAIETGLSDFRLMIYATLKTTFTKLQPKEFQYRCYKFFDEDNSLTDLKHRLESIRPVYYSYFQDIFESTLDKHAQLRKKIIRGNIKPHISNSGKRS